MLGAMAGKEFSVPMMLSFAQFYARLLEKALKTCVEMVRIQSHERKVSFGCAKNENWLCHSADHTEEPEPAVQNNRCAVCCLSHCQDWKIS